MKTRLRCLLVEDNPADADLVQIYLSNARQAVFEVECVPRLESAMSILEREDYDLVLLDLGLPDSSGLDTLSRVVEAFPRTTIVVLTGLDDELAGMEAVRSGAQDFVSKAHLAPDTLIRTCLYSAERRRTQEELRRSEDRYRSLFDNMLEGFAHCRMLYEDNRPQDFVFLNVNLAFSRLTGLKNVIGRKWSEVIPGIRESNPELLEVYGRVCETGTPERLETCVEPLGIWLSLSVYSDQREYFTVVFENITERKHFELGLQTSHRLLQAALRETEIHPLLKSFVQEIKSYTGCDAVGIRLLDEEGNIPYMSYDGFSRRFFDLESPLATKSDRCMCINVINGGVDPNLPFYTAGGSFYMNATTQFLATVSETEEGETRIVCNEFGYESVAVVPVRVADQFFGLIHVADSREDKVPLDTVELLERTGMQLGTAIARIKAEQRLKHQSAVLTAVLNSPHETVALVDTSGTVLRVNEQGAKRFGLTPDEMVGKNVFALIPEPVSSERRRVIAEVMRTGQPAHFEDRREDSDYVSSIYPVTDPQSGDLLGVAIFAGDITERKHAEAERGRLMAAIQQAGEAVVMTDDMGTIQYVNPAFEKITGYDRSEAVGRTSRILKSGQHEIEFYRQLWDTIKGGKIWSGRFVNKRKDGRLYHEDATISPVKEDSGRIVNFVAVKRDITAHLELSKQLQQAQKMEAVGTLAGGVAHDFNNILQVVLGYSELVLGDEYLPQPHRSDLCKIRDSARRGADLVQRLLTFSRKSEIQPKPVDLNRRIRSLRKMLERTLPKMIDIQLVLEEKLDNINADWTQIDQVLMNLAVNARDAMPNGGNLIFETAAIVLDEDYARTHLEVEPGKYVLLTVTDTGSGMDKDTLEHIFEPFFTTKNVGKGTGLGLALVHGIVKQHGGHVRCYSETGHGTTFKIYLPAAGSEGDVAPEGVQPIPLGGAETILLVDDEDLIRDLASRILANAGYHVIEASNGREALDIYQRLADEISLVVLDLVMPKMGGLQCLQGLLEFNPSVKVIIASGYSANGPTKDALSAGCRGFVGKPYVIRQLLEVVRSVLDELKREEDI